MPNSKDPKLDEIKPVEELVGESTEEPKEVVNIRIPRREKKEEVVSATTAANIEKPVESSLISDKLNEPDEENKSDEKVVPEVKTDEPQMHANLTSFSLLDADKGKSEVDTPANPETTTAEVKTEPSETSTSDANPTTDTNASSESADTPQASTDDLKSWLDDNTQSDEKKGSGAKKIIIGLFLVFLATTLLGGGAYYYQSKINNTESVTVDLEETESDAEPTATMTPSPEPVDLSVYKMQIQNGSGKPGEAGNVEVLLVEAGFEDIATGNASKYDYEETEVAVKKGTPDDVFNTIKDTIGASYVVIKATKELDSDSDYDVVITVGSSEPELTLTPSPATDN